MVSDISLIINSNGRLQTPIITDEITWKTERYGVPGELTFTTVKDDKLSYSEGSPVALMVDDKKVFYGFVFTKSRDKKQRIKVTAYDQLRYFKNKDTLSYSGWTCGELITKLAEMYNLRVGELENTEYKVAGQDGADIIEDNVTLFDMVQNNLDETVQATNKMYVMYDDYGKITLKNIEKMRVPYLVDSSCIENFDYKTSIDSDVYNYIKVYQEDDENSVRNTFVAKNSDDINKWGLLKYTDTISDPNKGPQKAAALLELYDRVARNLTVKDAIGDLRVRAGCHVPVSLFLGDISSKGSSTYNSYLIVDSVTHKWKNNNHTMDMTLCGGAGFVA